MQDKKIMNENEEFDLVDVVESARYSMEIERTFTELQRGLAVCYDPKEIALNVMRVATDFYNADWCGILEVDLELGVFSPFWWYNRTQGPMAKTLMEEVELMEYQRWIDSLKNHTAMIVEDIESIRDTYPNEYELYSRVQVNNLIAVPFWKGPTGFLVLKNPKRYTKQTSFLRMLIIL